MLLAKTLLVAAAIAGGLLASPPAAATPTRIPELPHPGQYCLALGDSLSYGLRPAKLVERHRPARIAGRRCCSREQGRR